MHQQKTEFLSTASLLGPAWRWRGAQHLVEGRTVPGEMRQDAMVREAAHYWRRVNTRGADSAARDYPDVATALELWKDSGSQREFKILVTGNCPPEECAQRLGVTRRIVDLVEGLFFAVRDMRTAPSWMNSWVMAAESSAGERSLAAKLRLAYAGGPEVARLLLDAPGNVGDDDVNRLIQMELQLEARLFEANEIPLSTPAEALRLQKIFLDYQLRKDRLQLESQKLALRYHQVLQKHKGSRRPSTQTTAKETAATAAASPLASLTWRRSPAAPRRRTRNSKPRQQAAA